MSTEFTRTVSIDQVCKDEEVCHLYATLPEDPSTSVFFNVHSGLLLDNITFVIKASNTIIASKISSLPFRLDNVESIGQRNIHSVLITDLTPDCLYHLEIQSPNGSVLKDVGYKTLPGTNFTSLKIAAGGDLGMT